jgi:N-acetyl-D-muramate 6-phosphate phosphatase
MPDRPAREKREGSARKPPQRLPVRAVLFDLDGTLADTAADLGNALNRVRADRALPPLPLATLRPQSSHGARGLLAAGFGIGKDHADFQPLRDAFLAYYAEALCEQTTLFP